MGPRDYESFVPELAAFQVRFPIRDEDLANCVRGYVQRGDWPEWLEDRGVLAQLLSKLHLRTRRSPELVASTVMLLDAMHGDEPLTWAMAFAGQPGGGGLYPASAIEHSEHEPLPADLEGVTGRDEFLRRETLLTVRWLAARGRATANADEVRALLGERMRAFLGAKS